MKCYTHRASDAIGLCRNCGRGLCPECLTEVGMWCACRNRCESQVADLNRSLSRANAAQRQMGFVPAFLILAGIVFIWWSGLFFAEHPADPFTLTVGILFVLSGVASFFIQRKR